MNVHPGFPKYRDPQAELAPIRRALQENEDWYVDVVEHSQDLLCIHDLNGRLLMVNPAPARLLGYSVEEILRIPMRELLAPEVLPKFEEYLREIERTGASRGTTIVVTRSGERRVWEYHNTLRTEGVAIPIVRGIAHDVTDRTRAENRERQANETLREKVREGERSIQELKLFRSLVDQSNDSILVVDPETLRLLDANEKCCVRLGYTRDEMLALRVFDINPAMTEATTSKILEQLKNTGFLQFESVHRRKDGSTLPVDVNLTRVVLDRVYVVAIARDITKRKRDEERLREYERVVEGLEENFMVVDRDYRYVIANRAFLNYRGLEKEQVLGHRVTEIVDPEVFERIIKKKMDECFGGKSVHYEISYKYPKLGERRMQASYFPVEGSDGIDRIAMILRDVTERRHTEQRLNEYERAAESMEEMISVVDRDYRFMVVNRAFAQHRGMQKEQLLGHVLFDQLRTEGTSEAVMALIKQKLDECFTGRVVQYEMKFEYSHLGERDLCMTYIPMEGPEGIDRITSVMRDVTERTRAEQALRQREESYRMFVSESSEGIFREDPDAPIPINLSEDELVHRILYDHSMAECNDAMAAMYGFVSGSELLGGRLTEMVVPDDPRNLELTREFIRSGFRLIDRESHAFDIHGNPKVFLNSMIGTVENGMLVHTWGIQRDITEKVKMEKARLESEEELRHTVCALSQVTAELELAKEKLAEEKLYLEESIDTELGFGEIIGHSSALKEVMQKVARVAPSDATVLLLGETGTGKELVARAIHRQSKREGKSFIKMNCAAIPSGLLESELFGHEKGAFTGAIARKLGRLELADKGTLFLDEIGEIPLSLQPKLLRVLQDLEFERLGGIQTLKVNFRLLAATNRDLFHSMQKREFRSDLYYRLNVFPILIPPLRERREDIRPLVEHFVRKFSLQMKKSITSIPSRAMELLVRWEWPGNIRELENFVERSVILSSGSVLQSPLSELEKDPSIDAGNQPMKLRDKNRERILQVLRECKGKLGGPDGAAARLGLKRTTLQSKLDQMGIKPSAYRQQA